MFFTDSRLESKSKYFFSIVIHRRAINVRLLFSFLTPQVDIGAWIVKEKKNQLKISSSVCEKEIINKRQTPHKTF